MLHWLAGQRPNDRDNNDDHLEPPETPAPIFAVRAFKHALFGTPAALATHQKARRNSTQDKDFLKAVANRPSRPVLTRPKSANDANTLGRIDTISPSSPTKGILLTPGTAGGRGKTVTFGDHIFNKNTSTEEPRVAQETNAPLVQRHPGCSYDPISMLDISEEEPTCAAGKYWKREYDIYRENTSRELRKLITKQKAAKSFAKEKDTQCTLLTEELQSERRNVQRLEDRAHELEAQLKEMQAQLAAQKTTVAAREQQQQSLRQTRSITRTAEIAEAEKSIAPTRAQQPSETSDFDFASLTLPDKSDVSVDRSDNAPKRPRLQPRHDSLDPGSTDDNLATIENLRTRERRSRQLPLPPIDSTPKPVSLIFEDSKENIPEQPTAISPQASSLLEQSKPITSRTGTIIPPDRVAAARARLTARRQSRIAS